MHRVNTRNKEQKHIPKYAVFLAYVCLFFYYTKVQDYVAGLTVVPWVGVLFLLVTIWGFLRLLMQKENYVAKPIALIF